MQNTEKCFCHLNGYAVKDATARADIENLKKRTDSLEAAKKYIFIADSYGNSEGSWITNCANALGLAPGSYYSSALNSGAFYDDTKSFLNHALKSIQIDNPDSITDIVVCGGLNDSYGYFNGNTTLANIESHMAAFIAYCKQTFVNAKIYIGYIGHQNEVVWGLNNFFGKAYDVIKLYRNCAKYGALYLSNVEYLLHDLSLIGSDGRHPTAAGGATMGVGIAQALQTGSVNVNKYMFMNYSEGAIQGITSSTIQIVEHLENGSCHLQISDSSNAGYARVIYDENQSGNIQRLGKLKLFENTTKGLFQGFSKFSVPCCASIIANGETKSDTGILEFDKGVLSIRFNTAYSGVSEIGIFPVSYSFPTLWAR